METKILEEEKKLLKKRKVILKKSKESNILRKGFQYEIDEQ